ncbi:alpha/beta hydrolase [Kutzneria sp. NPDC052558]|uniref:alpha/beta hydrolase n=1 Tax=Kutzneria sp. NPDC052558 TaxID=3364121 RepID=UPI0037C5E29C
MGSFWSLDGLRLAGTLTLPPSGRPPRKAVVLAHSEGVDRDENGLFPLIADALAAEGVASLRFDHRGHGDSAGTQEERTLTEHLNDLRAAVEHVRSETGARRVSLVGNRFSGGLAAFYAARRPTELDRLVLLTPQLNFKGDYIDQNRNWVAGRLATPLLAEVGHLEHAPGIRHGRAFLNEAFWVRPSFVFGEILPPTLIVHGTKDDRVPIESSRAAVRRLKADDVLVEVDGIGEENKDFVTEQVVDWITFGE